MSTFQSDDDKYLPQSYRVKRALRVHFSEAIVDKIEEFIKVLIEEDRYDRSPDRQED